MKTFAYRLKEARKNKGWSQEELARSVNVARQVVSGWEQEPGRDTAATPSPDRAVLAAQNLGEDPKEFLLLSLLRDAVVTNPEGNQVLEQVVKDIISKLHPPKATPSVGPSTHLSLCDFPQGFHEPFTIVVGDKRETPPKTVGDLAAFSASTVDDRWLHDLKLPSGSEKISDKVFMMAKDEWLRKTFGKNTIISIASPASNLFSRLYNEEFIFRFALRPQVKTEWESMRSEIHERKLNRPDCPPAELESLNTEHGSRFKWLMREFKGGGFIDFNFEQLHVGFVGDENKDFAVISIGPNPFSDPEDPRFAILVAGAQYPGTALGLRRLADPSFFEKHPFGGILESDVPRREVSAQTISWWNRIENSDIYWHAAGGGDLAYLPNDLRTRLTEWSDRISKGSLLPSYVTREEIDRHINLIDTLKR